MNDLIQRCYSYTLFDEFKIVEDFIVNDCITLFKVTSMKTNSSTGVLFHHFNDVVNNNIEDSFLMNDKEYLKSVKTAYFKIEQNTIISYDHFILLDDFIFDDAYLNRAKDLYSCENYLMAYGYLIYGLSFKDTSCIDLIIKTLEENDLFPFLNKLYTPVFYEIGVMFGDGQCAITLAKKIFDKEVYPLNYPFIDLCDIAISKGFGKGYYYKALYLEDKIVQTNILDEVIHYLQLAINHDCLEAYYDYARCVFTYRVDDTYVQQAIKYLKLGDHKGIVSCSYYLGVCYQTGSGVLVDYDLSKLYLEKAIRGKFYEAIPALALLYENGWGVEQDLNQVRSLLLVGARSYHLNSMFVLAKFYFAYNNYTYYDLRALYWLKKGHYLNEPKFSHALGSYYERGEFANIDFGKSINYYLEGSKLGHIECSLKLANHFVHPKQGTKNIEFAKMIYNDLMKNNSIEGYLGMADLYYQGLDKPDLDNWNKILDLIVTKGSGEGYVAKGLHYFDTNLVLAKQYFKQAIAIHSGSGAYWLGKIYVQLGELTKARICFKQAIEYKYYKGFIGIGYLEEDFKEKERYFNKAIQMGCFAGYYDLGMLYLSRNESIYDVKAYTMFKKGCYEKHLRCCYGLGLCYAYARGCNGDGAKAISVLEFSTLKESYYLRGLILEKGLFTKKDRQRSNVAYGKAKELGYLKDQESVFNLIEEPKIIE